MKNRFSLIILTIISFFLINSQSIITKEIKKQYTILPQSKLQLKVCSNIKDFTCVCKQTFPKSSLELQWILVDSLALFKNTNISLQTKKLNCGHQKINRDLYSTLKVDKFPKIFIELKKIQLTKKKDKSKQKILAKAEVALTIAQQSRVETIWAEVTKESKNDFHIIAEKTLKMTDFNLSPPTELFNLVRIEDDILICLDLFIKTEP